MSKNRRNRNIPVDDMYNVGIDNFSNREQQQVYESTKDGTENLKQSTIDSSLSTAGTKSDLTIEQTGLKYERDIHTLEGFLSAIDKLLQELENIKSGTSKKGLSKAGKQTMDIAKDKIKQYEKILQKKKDKLTKERNAEINEIDITIFQKIFGQLEHLKYDIHKGQFGEYSNTASYMYNSPETAKKSNKYQADNLKFNQKFQEELKEGAIVNIFNKSTQQANDFFRRIAQGEYTATDYQLFRTNSSVLVPYCQRHRIPIPTSPRGGRISGGNFERSPRTYRATSDYRNLDRGETFQQGGLAGIIDKALNNCNNLTPGQRNTWKSIAVLGGYAAGIFGLFKFYTNKKMSIRSKAGITAAAVLGSQIATGENPIALFQKLMTGGFSKEYLEDKFGNAFGDAINGIGNSGIEASNTLAPAMYSMMIFKPSMTVGETRALTSKFKSNQNEWKTFRGEAITKLKNKYGENSTEHFSATFSDNFDEQKWTNRLASFGVTDSTADNKNIYELANNAAMNEIILEKFRSKYGVKDTDTEVKKKEFQRYINDLKTTNQALDIKILEKHKNDWFKPDENATYTEREVDETFKQTLESQIDSLGIDEPKKSELKTALKRFYDERNINTKPLIADFSLTMEGGFLILTSREGQKTKIKIDTNEIEGFGHKFSDLSELLNVADISNKILHSQKGKVPKDMPPFQFKMERKGICFNDATRVRKDIITRNYSGMDTRVLSTGRGGATSKIDTLSKHPEDYAAYLSERWKEENKVNVDSTLYPTVKALSDTGIDFFNEQEVKELENWLQQIKKKKEASIGKIDGDPFKTSRKWFDKKLVFVNVNGEEEVFEEDISEKFPTIMRNKDKFLAYMNDKSNGMRGSKLN